MQARSPAQLFALVIGATLVVAGIVGFFYNSSFAVGDETLTNRDAVFGILDVNAWHNLVHIGSGAVGLALMGSYAGARTYALGLGVVYTVVVILGFAYGDGDAIFKLIPVNTEDNILHLLIAATAFGAYAATPAEPAPTTAPAT
jgi:Domain of unknown function (DUF4383)